MAVYHLNYHTLEGNVGQDATVGQTANGEYYTRWTLANTQGDKTNSYNCVMWGENKAKIAPRITKGTKIVVVGSTTLDSYTPKGGGDLRYSLAMNVQSVSIPKDQAGASTPAAENDDTDLDDELDL